MFPLNNDAEAEKVVDAVADLPSTLPFPKLLLPTTPSPLPNPDKILVPDAADPHDMPVEPISLLSKSENSNCKSSSNGLPDCPSFLWKNTEEEEEKEVPAAAVPLAKAPPSPLTDASDGDGRIIAAIISDVIDPFVLSASRISSVDPAIPAASRPSSPLLLLYIIASPPTVYPAAAFIASKSPRKS